MDVFCAYSEIVDITTLVPNPRNPNTHPKAQILLLANIIKNSGWRRPITVSTRSGYIVKGHGALEAAQLLELETVPVDWQDYNNEAAEHADLIADNRIAELAEIDNPVLKDLLADLDTGDFDMDLTGFDKDALEMLMTEFHPPDEPEENNEPTVKIVTCPDCGKVFTP